MYIYLIHAEVHCPHCGGEVIKLYKIGRSVEPEKRVSSIATASPSHTAELICVVWAGPTKYKKLEEALHMLFAKRHHHGEWFDLSVSNVKFVRGLTMEVIDKLLVARKAALKRKEEGPEAKTRPLWDTPTRAVDEGKDWRTWVYGGARNPIHDI